MKNHPVTELFPLMAGKDYEKLVADIREHGLREPIWLHPDGGIVDGRNRARACKDIGIEPSTRVWNGEGPLTAFVVSLNLHRRHLTSSQRAAAAAEAVPMLKAEAKERQGQRTDLRTDLPQKIGESQHSGEAAERAAKMFDTNREYVRVAVKLKDEAPDVFAAVKSGVLNVYDQRKIQDHIERVPEVKQRVISLGLGAEEMTLLAELSEQQPIRPCSDKTETGLKGWVILDALDIFEANDTGRVTIKTAVAKVRKNISEEGKKLLEEWQKQYHEEIERQFREREPFEYFAEFLVELVHYDERLKVIQRHIKNCGLEKLQGEIDKRLVAEEEAERAAETATETVDAPASAEGAREGA